ncbi:MAG: hypothetical protein IPG04_29630 [Polyangiaceae bacterium]|nr:hypothetical protein [Polyangiaceae bacterium]
MSPDERIVVLESLLAKVRRAAEERGVELPRDLPPGIWKDRLKPKKLTAFTETGEGTHAPLALVEPPVPASRPLTTPSEASADFAPPISAAPTTAAPTSAPLIGFGYAFEDEITSDASPEQIEALVLDEIEKTALEERAAGATSRAGDAPVSPSAPPPVPPAAPTLSSLPGPQARPSTLPRASSPPIELDDLDDLVVPAASAAPPPLSVPPPLPPERMAPALAKPPPAHEPSALERAFAAVPPRPALAPPPHPAPAVVPPPPPPSEPPPTVQPASSEPPEPVAAESLSIDAVSTDAVSTDAVSTDAVSRSVPITPHISVVPPPEPSIEPPKVAEPSLDEAALDEPIPESQRQKVSLERPIDDSLEGVEEHPPESGEVESQRVASRAREPSDSHVDEAEAGGHVHPLAAEPSAELPPSSPRVVVRPAVDDEPLTPRPAHDVTAEVRSLGDVDVISRPAAPRVEVATTRGTAPRAPITFGELLDRALELGEP